MSEGRIAGRAALVTGAGDGIGLAIARRFAAEGAAVLIAEFDDAKGEAAAAAIRDAGGKALFRHCDVTCKDEIEAAVADCVARFGAIDILVNNAYRGPGLARIENKSDEVFAQGREGGGGVGLLGLLVEQGGEHLRGGAGVALGAVE